MNSELIYYRYAPHEPTYLNQFILTYHRSFTMSQPFLDIGFTKTYHKNTYEAISPSNPSLSARGKTILVTGGTAGIGFSIVKSLAIAGASNIIIIARRPEALAETKKNIETSYPSTKIHTFTAAITDSEEIKSIFAQIRDERIDEPDVLILNAAILNFPAPTLSIPVDEITSSFETNVMANLNLVRNYLTPDTLNKPKKIINISSTVAHALLPMFAAYGASKLAFVHLLLYIQSDLADKDVRIINLQPGAVLTDMARGAGYNEDNFDKWDDGKSKSSARCISALYKRNG